MTTLLYQNYSLKWKGRFTHSNSSLDKHAVNLLLTCLKGTGGAELNLKLNWNRIPATVYYAQTRAQYDSKCTVRPVIMNMCTACKRWFCQLRGLFYMYVWEIENPEWSWSGGGNRCHSSPDTLVLGTYPPPHWNNKGQSFLLVITQLLTRENSQQKRGLCGGLFPQSIQLLSDKRLVQYVEGLNVSYSGRSPFGDNRQTGEDWL